MFPNLPNGLEMYEQIQLTNIFAFNEFTMND